MPNPATHLRREREGILAINVRRDRVVTLLRLKGPGKRVKSLLQAFKLILILRNLSRLTWVAGIGHPLKAGHLLVCHSELCSESLLYTPQIRSKAQNDKKGMTSVSRLKRVARQAMTRHLKIFSTKSNSDPLAA